MFRIWIQIFLMSLIEWTIAWLRSIAFVGDVLHSPHGRPTDFEIKKFGDISSSDEMPSERFRMWTIVYAHVIRRWNRAY